MARPTGTLSVADLLDRGVLRAGEEIVIRRRSAPLISATIQPDGTIKLGRQGFKTPTGAAKEALNVRSVDGWLRWRVPRLDGRSLAELRESL